MNNSKRNTASENNNERRIHLNTLEKNRRDNLKQSFEHLRDTVSNLQGSQNATSRIQILRNTAEHIGDMHDKISNQKNENDKMIRQNNLLLEQVRLLLAQGADISIVEDLITMGLISI
ncbi:hypothetical protein HCN44_009468 [Aphidius gifuensis]|uniref:BHLH domain-containing protein n=1 Tax=Aphidius gifuensis TaxID=684658 RepID=A0A834Y2B6_APHGI|nr:hypothetical protein HCN44_009468 [Aphidius gifuensis]